MVARPMLVQSDKIFFMSLPPYEISRFFDRQLLTKKDTISLELYLLTVDWKGISPHMLTTYILLVLHDTIV